MALSPALTLGVPPQIPPIKFGTDGWRGVIAADFTFERLMRVAPLAAQVLEQTYGKSTPGRRIVVGYDRRFLAEEFAQAAATAVSAAGYEVLLADHYAPTPALSWAVKQQGALGALVITASHNPGQYSGLKVKGAFGGSVPPAVTQQIEALLQHPAAPLTQTGQLETFNPWPGYWEVLKQKVNLPALQQAVETGKLVVFVDTMHGATAGGLSQLLGDKIQELHSDRDPLFGGGAPEPIARYLQSTCAALHQFRQTHPDQLSVGLVFDGDGDRIAAVDGEGNFISAQVLIPLLIDHLALHRGFRGEVIKSISSSDLIPRVAALHGLSVYETPIGFKYIADRMLESEQVFLGGEESGGIGYGNHIPERDGLLSGLYLLEAMIETGVDLSAHYRSLQEKTGYASFYDRIDLPLVSLDSKNQLESQLATAPPTEIIGQKIIEQQSIDGYKFRLENQSWLLIRFSGTEPLLRLYCEAPTPELVQATLDWAQQWAAS